MTQGSDQGAATRVRTYVVLLLVLGLALVAAVVVPAGPVEDPLGAALLGALLGALAAGSIALPLRVHREGAVWAFHLLTGCHVALLVLVPAHVAVGVTLAASFTAYVRRRTARIKLAFNMANDMVAVAASALTFVAILGPGEPSTLRTVVAAGAALLAAELVNAFAMALLFVRLRGVRLRAALEDTEVVGVTGLVGVLGNGGAAVLLALLGARSPLLVLFALPPLVAMFLGYRGYLRQSGERERAEGLQRTSRLLVDAATDPGSLDAAVDGLRDLFSAEQARLVLRDEPRGDGSQDASLVGGVLSRGRAEVREEPQAMATPVVLDGHVVAALVVSGRRGVDKWQPADLALLGTVAEEIAGALRTRQLLTNLEAERRATEVESAKLADIVGAASDGIVLLAPDGTVLTFNPAMELLTGLTAAEVVDRPWDATLVLRDVRDQAVTPDGWGRVAQALRGEVRVRAARLQLQRTDGEWRWLRCSSAPVTGEDGSFRGVVLVLQDRTREVEVENLRADFVATVSHELRTPLTPLRGWLETLADRGPELQAAELERALDAMGYNLSRLETLIADLLVVAEVQRGTQRSTPAPVPVHEVVAEAVANEAAGVDELRVEQDLPPGVAVLGDRAAAVRVVRNLLSNGLKHTNGQVRLLAHANEHEVVIAVEDDGPGIGRWGRDVVFEPFGRLGDHLLRPAGPGLGLAIARSLAEGMGGRLTLVDSSEGARFELVLPRSGGVVAGDAQVQPDGVFEELPGAAGLLARGDAPAAQDGADRWGPGPYREHEDDSADG